MIATSGQPNGQGAPLSPTPGTTGGVGGPAASPPGGTPKNQRRVRPPQTFAGMQQQGVARPSPQIVQQQAAANQQAAQPAPAPAPAQPMSYGQAMPQPQGNVPQANALGGGMIGSLGNTLNQQVMQMLADPTAGLNEAAMSNFDRQQRQIGQQFADTRDSLNENLAARGLDSSTIAASGLSRLAERQGQAMADSSAQIQEQLIRDRSAALNNALNAAMGLRGQEMTLDQNLWQRSDADRRFGLDQTLGLGNLDINRQNLALNRDRFGFEQQRDTRDFEYGKTRDAANDAFRNKEFDYRKGVDERDFTYRQGRDTVADAQFNKNFDYRRDTDNRDFDYRQGRDKIGDERFDRTWERDQTWRTEDNQYRDNRDTIGDQRWDKTFDWNKSNANTQNIMSLLQNMGMGSVSPQVLQQIFGSLGLSMPNSTPNPVLTGGGDGAPGSGYYDGNTFF